VATAGIIVNIATPIPMERYRFASAVPLLRDHSQLDSERRGGAQGVVRGMVVVGCIDHDPGG
jgi:hypothetical protein